MPYTFKLCSACNDRLVEVDPLYPADALVFCERCLDVAPALVVLRGIEKDWPRDG